MFTLTPFHLLLIMVLALFVIGVLTFIAGVFILVFRASSKDLQTLATQTTRLAQKGLAEEIAGLVGNATNLLDTLNQLMRTTRGIGIFLAILGLLLMSVACWFAFQSIK